MLDQLVHVRRHVRRGRREAGGGKAKAGGGETLFPGEAGGGPPREAPLQTLVRESAQIRDRRHARRHDLLRILVAQLV